MNDSSRNCAIRANRQEKSSLFPKRGTKRGAAVKIKQILSPSHPNILVVGEENADTADNLMRAPFPKPSGSLP